MRSIITTIVLLAVLTNGAWAQEMQTLFKSEGMSHGGYGVISNKFTTIDGEFANLVEVYGGWFINHKLMLGAGGGGTTNFIRVPESESRFPGRNVTYQYSQAGFVMEYVVGSRKAVHAVFHMFTGGGFSFQYVRGDDHYYDYDYHDIRDENWFVVVEPGVQVELNLFRWMRFSPGVSYRFVTNSDSGYLTNDKLSGMSVNLSMKFGKF